MGDEVTHIAERLVATVARAFYTDNFVVLFDALIREKYIREEELGPRLKLPNEEVRKIVVQLKKEQMISFEERLMESDLRRSNCYYIDYQHFVHVVRYRIHVMQSEIRNSENVELNRHFLVCPTCKTKYSELEYYKVRDKNNKFICQHCCPLQSFRTIESEKYYQLVEYDRTAKMNEVQALGAKYKRQFGRSEGHEGIYELLAQLRDVSVTRNLPSENIVRGNVASRVVDAEVQSQIDYNNVGVKAKKLSKLQQQQRTKLASASEFKVQFTEDETNVAASSATSNGASNVQSADSLSDEPAAKRPRQLPSFLQGSHIVEDNLSADGQSVGGSSSLLGAASSGSTGGMALGSMTATKDGDNNKSSTEKTDASSSAQNEEDLWED